MLLSLILLTLSAAPEVGATHASPLHAAPPEAGAYGHTPLQMTLAEALDYARHHQPALQAALARVEAAQRSTELPRALWYPRIAATAQILYGSANNSTASYFGAAGVDLPRIGATQAGSANWRPHVSTLVALGVRQSVYEFGRISALSAVADEQQKAELGRADETRLELLYVVQESFFAVHAARELLASAEAALDRARVLRESAAAGVDSGLRSPIELTRAEAALARFSVGAVRARAGLTVAQGMFAAAVGVPEMLLDAAGEVPPTAPVPPLAEALQRAVDRSPLVVTARARLTEQRAQSRAIFADLLPDISASATLSAREGGAPPSSGSTGSGGSNRNNGLVPKTPNWDVGIVISIPLYDRSTYVRAQVSAALERALDAELADVEERLRAALQQAYVDYDTAMQGLPALEQAVSAGRANCEQAKARFDAAMGTSVELADAQDLLSSAEVALALGRFDCVRARAFLGRLIAEEP